jgi:ionotropic glutamate receptor NMDA 2B
MNSLLVIFVFYAFVFLLSSTLTECSVFRKKPSRTENSASETSAFDSNTVQKITLGAILPTTALITIKRAYDKRIASAAENLMRGRQTKFNFTNYFVLSNAQVVLIPLNPSPNEVLDTLCNQLLVKNVTAVIYMTNSDIYGHNAASAQYLMQLIGYLGIPMIAWNADNVGLEQVPLFN